MESQVSRDGSAEDEVVRGGRGRLAGDSSGDDGLVAAGRLTGGEDDDMIDEKAHEKGQTDSTQHHQHDRFSWRCA